MIVKLKNTLTNKNRLETEGVFRLAGSENTIKRVKLELNLDKFQDCEDVHSVASLLKVIHTKYLL